MVDDFLPDAAVGGFTQGIGIIFLRFFSENAR